MVDRVIVYDAALPQVTDILDTNKFMMEGFANAFQGILGTASAVVGLPCSATGPASLNVVVGLGSIYGLATADATAYGDLGTDATQIVKQGILAAPVTLTLTPPVTSGFSQVYLIEVALEDIDNGSEVIPYFNSADSGNPFSGPANDGEPNFTIRNCQCVVQLKAGTPATTGTQIVPSTDPGFVALYTVTLSNGQLTITSGNIIPVATAPFFPTLPAIPYDVQDNIWVYAADSSVGGPAPATTATTATSSAVITIGGGVPAYVTNGMKAFDLTTPGAITGGQTVISKTGTTVTLSGNVNATVGSGDLIAFSGNAMAAAISPIPPMLVPGMAVEVKASGTNSGTCTFNLNGLGAVAIHRATGAVLQPGDITAGQVVRLIYDGSSWQLSNYTGAGSGGTTNTFNTAIIPYATDSSGTPNIVVASYTPAISSLTAGLTVEVKVANTVTGASTFNPNGTGAVALVDRRGNPLTAGAIVASQVALLIYDGTHWQIVSVSGTTSLLAGVSANKLGVTLTNTTRQWTADSIIVSDASGNTTQLSAMNITLNSATSGLNGLDTGSLAANTPYYEFVVYNPSTGGSGALMSLSRTAPTLPSGYTQFGRLGGDAITDGSNNFYRITRKADMATYTDTPTTNTATCPVIAVGLIGGGTKTNSDFFNNPFGCWATISLAHLVPASAQSVAFITTTYIGVGSQSDIYIAPNPNYGGIFSTNPPPISSTAPASSVLSTAFPAFLLLESQNIYAYTDRSGAQIQVFGYLDPIVS